MGWAVGWDSYWQRDVGYGVPSICDQPGCDAKIDRGLAYVCGSDVYGGEYGCGLFFCEKHLGANLADEEPDRGWLCDCCAVDHSPYDPTPDLDEWLQWKLIDESWQQWRDENPDEVARIRGYFAELFL